MNRALPGGGSGGESLAEYLQRVFLDEKNRIAWGALGSSIISGLILVLWNGIRGFAEAIGQAAVEFSSPVTGSMSAGYRELEQTIATQVSDTFVAVDVGALSGPLNLVIALVSLVVVTLLINYLWSFWRDF